MPNTPARAVVKANTITVGYGGLCLKFVRTCYNIPAKYPSARSAWQNAKRRHPTTNLSTIPVGAPLFMDSATSLYGHVAIYMGNGKMRTTNSATNRVTTVTVESWSRYGYRVLGWTEDLNGVTIPGLDPKLIAAAKKRDKAAAVVAKVRKTLGRLGWASTRAKKKAAQQILKDAGYYVGKGTDIDGIYGPLNKKAWRAVKAAAK